MGNTLRAEQGYRHLRFFTWAISGTYSIGSRGNSYLRSGETELLDHSIYEFEFNAQFFDPPTQPQVTEFALVPNNEQRSVEVSLTISDAIDGFAQYQPGTTRKYDYCGAN